MRVKNEFTFGVDAREGTESARRQRVIVKTQSRQFYAPKTFRRNCPWNSVATWRALYNLRREMFAFRDIAAMPVQFARPDLAELVLCAFQRRLHPELFHCRASATLQRADWLLEMRLCTTGHWIELKLGDQIVTEAICERQIPLPKFKSVWTHRLKGCRSQAFELSEKLRYTVNCQVERLEPVIYRQVHEELLADCRQAELSVVFPTGNRWSPGALSLLKAGVDRDSVLIHAFHTFPEHCAVLKTQTLFELVGDEK